MNREPYVGGVIFIQRTEKPKYCGSGKTERYRFPVGAVELKEVNEDTKKIQCLKLKAQS